MRKTLSDCSNIRKQRSTGFPTRPKYKAGNFEGLGVQPQSGKKEFAIDGERGLRVAHIFVILRITPINVQHKKMIRCHMSTLMGRDKLRISDVAKSTGLNRSTVTALYNETATRIDLPAVESLCTLFRCQVGELFEIDASIPEGQP